MKKKLIGVAIVAGLVTAILVIKKPWSGSGSPAGPLGTAATRTISIKTVKVARNDIRSAVYAEGTARAVRREYLVFEKAGRIEFVRKGSDGGDLREGERVTAGELLARQDQRLAKVSLTVARTSQEEALRQVEIAKAELDQAKAEHALAKAQLARKKAAREANAVTAQEFDEAVAGEAARAAGVTRAETRLKVATATVTSAEAKVSQAKVELEQTELHAPIDGILAYVNIKAGYYFTPSLVRSDSEEAALKTLPMVVIDPTDFEVTVSVPFYEANRIREGQPVWILSATEGLPKEVSGRQSAPRAPALMPVSGRVFSVNPAINPGGRSIELKIRTEGEPKGLRDGMFVSCWIATDEVKDAITVPLEALLYRDNTPYVYVIDSERQVASPVDVVLGIRDLSRQEVRSGLAAGQWVATDGRYQLVENSPVRILGGQEPQPERTSPGKEDE